MIPLFWSLKIEYAFLALLLFFNLFIFMSELFKTIALKIFVRRMSMRGASGSAMPKAEALP
jgi:hypothetical protein